MADSALGILQRDGEQRGAAGRVPDTADFDEHVSFYKGVLRVLRMFLALMAVFAGDVFLPGQMNVDSPFTQLD